MARCERSSSEEIRPFIKGQGASIQRHPKGGFENYEKENGLSCPSQIGTVSDVSESGRIAYIVCDADDCDYVERSEE